MLRKKKKEKEKKSKTENKENEEKKKKTCLSFQYYFLSFFIFQNATQTTPVNMGHIGRSLKCPLARQIS